MYTLFLEFFVFQLVSGAFCPVLLALFCDLRLFLFTPFGHRDPGETESKQTSNYNRQYLLHLFLPPIFFKGNNPP
jgi:hypothetical protein